jgi:hypothetical protein
MVLLRNLTIYEINPKNLILFLAETPFSHFCVGNDGNKFEGNTTEVFMENKQIETKEGMRGRLARKGDQVARPAGVAAPPGSIWASVAGSASPST